MKLDVLQNDWSTRHWLKKSQTDRQRRVPWVPGADLSTSDIIARKPAGLDMFIYDAALLAPWRFLLTSRSWLTQWSQCPTKKRFLNGQNHEKSQLPNFAPTFGWFSWIFMDFQSCFLFSTPINARRIALGSSTNRSGRCWWAKKTWAV